MFCTRQSCFLLVLLVFTSLLRAQSPRLVVPAGHTAVISSLKLSANDRFLLSASCHTPEGTKEDNTARLWDLWSGRLLHTFRARGLEAAFLTPDASLVLIADAASQTLIAYQTSSDRKPDPLLQGKNYTALVTISNDQRFIAAICPDSTIRIWDAHDLQLLKKIRFEGSEPKAIQFSPKTNNLAAIYSTTQGNVLTVWNVNGFSFSWSKPTNPENVTETGLNLMFSPNEKWICTYGFLTYTTLWNVQDGTYSKDELWHSHKFISFSADSKYLLTSNEEYVRVWDIAGHKESANHSSTGSDYSSAAFSPVKNDYFMMKDYRTIDKGYPGKYGTTSVKAELPESYDYLFTVSHDGKFIAVANNNKINVLNTENFKPAFDMQSQASPLQTMTSDHTGNTVVASYEPGIINVIHTGNFRVPAITNSDWDEAPTSVIFHPQDSFFVTASYNRLPKVFMTSNLEPVAIPGLDSINDKWEMSLSGKYIAVANSRDSMALFSTAEKIKITALTDPKVPEHWKQNNVMVFSPDETILITANNSQQPLVWSVPAGKLIGSLRDHRDAAHKILFTANQEFIISSSVDGTVRVYRNANDFPLLHTIKDWWLKTWPGMQILNNELEVLVSDTLYAYSIPSFSKIHTMPGTPVLFSYDFKNYRLGIDDWGRIWKQNTITGMTENLEGDALSVPASGKYFFIQNGNAIDYYDCGSGTKLFSTLFVNNTNFIFLPSGYYMGSKQSAKMLHYVNGLETIGFEQLDIRFNRPDKVLSAIGSTDTALIKSYFKAWQKRMKRLGLDTASFSTDKSIPTLKLINRDQISYVQPSESIALHLVAKDSVAVLDRLNVWINHVPLFGQRGIALRGRKLHLIDTTIHVKLASGVNTIEAGVTNTDGIESYRSPVTVNCTAIGQGKTWFIGIGIDQFEDARYNLSYSVKDIRDLAMTFQTRYKGNVKIDTLFNRSVTQERILALKNKLRTLGVNDRVIVAYSGHGLLDKEFDYYLSTYGIDFSNPAEKGIAYDALAGLLDSIPPRRKLLLIDACNSGEVDKEYLVRLSKVDHGLAKGLEPVKYAEPGTLGLQNSFDLMQELFVTVGENTGSVILSAAAGTQFALEKHELRNGVFTYCIIDALRKEKTISVERLKQLVEKGVIQLTNGEQRPTSRSAVNYDWTL